jgi:hypothetical protein
LTIHSSKYRVLVPFFLKSRARCCGRWLADGQGELLTIVLSGISAMISAVALLVTLIYSVFLHRGHRDLDKETSASQGRAEADR